MKTIANILGGVVAALTVMACAASDPADGTGASAYDLRVRPVAGSGSVCVQNVLCVKGSHWDSTQCKCVPDACVSDLGGACGGFVQNPCTCAAGLTCRTNKIADIPGTCEPTCCPTGFDMYACQEANGASGFNCHNPQLGCASSAVCGGGCDFAVSRRCPVCDPVPCPAGQVFDASACKCVPGCKTVTDCTGPLPQVCQVCSDGSTGCAHWACVANKCEVESCSK